MDNRRKPLFSRPGFAVLLFGLGLLAFTRPLLDIPARIGGAALWLYLFTVWAGLIAALFLAARPVERNRGRSSDPEHRGGG